MIICIKMDLALNNLQRLICHKTQTTKPTIKHSISTLFSSIWLVDRTLTGATIPGQSKCWSDGNEEVIRIPQSSSITEALPSYCLVLYPGHSLGESYPSADVCSQCILRLQQTESANYLY